ncbi:MAG: lamin tail domain-containing protein [Planctomycetes bacterium]|nr:lamin tail domain-containing protein [Planctomycetota bacterium]
MQASIEALEPRLVLDSTVVFNEIMYNPAQSDESLEWVELHNQNSVDVDISAWRIDDGINFDFPEGTIVPGGGYLVVAKDPAALAAAGIIGTAMGPYGGQLSNGGEQIDLRDRTDRLMDRLDYNDRGRWPVAPDGSGASLAKIDPNLASGDSESWSTSFVVGGTPGVENGLEKLGEPGDPPEPDIISALTTLSDPWRFEASGAAQPADWRELDFDDSAWGGAGGDADLVGYWDFEGNTNDRSGNGNDGVLKNGAALNADTPGGFSTQALRLSGTQYVLVPHDDSLNIATSMTIAAWVKPVGNVFWDGIIAKNPSAGSAANHAGNYELRINSSNRQLQFLWEQGGANTTTSASAGTSPIANNQWTHIAVTVVKGGSAEFYVNGSLIATRGVNASFGVTNTNALYIGDRADITSTPFDGLLDDVALWNGALEADAIAALAAKTASPLDFGANRGPYFAGSAPSPPGEGELPLGPTTYYFRQEFDFDEDSARTELVLNTLVDDGAIFYLNGDELHRQNMPAGAVSFGTLASSTVGIAVESGEIVVPASSLRVGRNVLAVEVHQASAADGDMLFATELTAITSPIQSVSFQPISLAINETAAAGAGDNDFWFELFNHGDETVDLDGFVVKSTAGDAHTLSGISIAPGAFVVLTEAQIGFDVLPQTRIFLYNEDESQVVSAAVVKILPTARHPDGTGEFLLPTTTTPGQPNAFALRDEIVINEIFYHAPEVLDESNPEEWLELYNRSGSVVDLAGWSLDGAVDFLFPLGTTLGPQQYLVVARDAAALRAKYPTIDVVGQYDGRLNNSTDRIVLEDPSGNPADVVEYYQDGRWSRDADGGGSSLELRDPNADNAVAEAWAASDESSKTAWRNYSYEGIVRSSAVGPDGQWNELVLGMLSRGEVLLDNISVIRDPQGAATEQVVNGGFESDPLGAVPSSWRMIGTHRHSEIIVDPADPNNRVLRFVATDPTEHMHNQANTTLRQSISNSVRYRISFDARWVSGSNQLNSRLYFNRLPATTLIDRPNQWGTPGEANSVLESNIGPTFEHFIHAPAVPEPNEPVTVLATVSDPSGVTSMTLRYSVGGGAFQSVTMRHSGGGNYQGTIPPQAAGTIVQFYAEATDGEGARATFPRSGADSRALYKVNDGLAATTGLHNLRFIMTPADANFMHATVNLMSNDRIGLTVIYDESEIFYDVGIRLSGSERARPFTVRLSFNVRFNTEHLFRGVQRTIALDRSESTGFGQQEALTHLVSAHVGMIPSEYNDLINIITPRAAHTGGAELQLSRFTDTFLSSQFANGDDGMLFEYELIYFPTSADAQGNKRPQPDGTRGTSLRTLGSDKENYRQNYLIKNNRSRDDYSRLIEFLQVMALGGSAFNNQIADVIDVDQWLRAFALTTISGAGDNFGSGAQHNAQFYVRPEDGRVLFFPHDLDAFLSPTLALAPGSVLPKLIADRTRAHMYYGHVYDMLTTTYNQDYMRHFTENYGSLLPGQNFAGHLAFINQRSNFLLGQINNVARPTDFAIITGSPLNVGNAPSATVTGNGWIDVREIRLAGSDQPLDVVWTDADSWRVILPVAAGVNDLPFEAYDYQDLPVGSASITVVSTVTERPQNFLRISELMYNPAPQTSEELATTAGGAVVFGNDRYEYIEIINTSDASVPLSGAAFVDGVQFGFDDAESDLGPGETIVIVRNQAAFANRYGSDPSLRVALGEYDGSGTKLSNVLSVDLVKRAVPVGRIAAVVTRPVDVRIQPRLAVSVAFAAQPMDHAVRGSNMSIESTLVQD